MYTNTSGKSFYHPVTNRLIRVGESYEIPAHQDHENVETPEVANEDDKKIPETLLKAAEKFGIETAGLTADEIKAAIKAKKEAEAANKKDDGQ